MSLAAFGPQPALLIDGKWRSARSSQHFRVIDPATESVLVEYPGATADETKEAADAAATAFPSWSSRTASDRGAVLRAGAANLRNAGEEIATLLTREEGKPLAEARREIDVAAAIIEWYAEEGRRACGRSIPSSLSGADVRTELVPAGPVAAFVPWNFPVMLSAIKVAAALAAGCTMILRPAEETPLAVSRMVDALVRAGLPAGVLQLLLGDGAAIAGELLGHPAVARFSFTGSTRVGRSVAEVAGRHLKPCTLELGGHAPAVICEDADVDAAVRALMMIKFRNAGQVCANASRFLVHEGVLTAFVQRMTEAMSAIRVAPGTDPSTTMGPLGNRRRVEAVSGLVEDAVSQGASARIFGPIPRVGCFHPPVLLQDVPGQARIQHEEPFGPLVPVTTFRSLDEAVSQANSLPVGLTAFGFTRSLATARRLARELRVGSVGINTTALMLPEAPFGGVAQSGWGRENGAEGLLAFMASKTFVMTD